MYGRVIRFAISKNVHESTIRPRRVVHPSNFFSSISTRPNHNKKPTLVDDIRESASGLPPVSSSGADDRVNVVRTSTTPSSSTSDGRENDGDVADFVADTAKKGVAKAMETGLGIGEMGKKTLDNVWDTTEAVVGDEKKDDAPANDEFVDGLRKHAGWYDLERDQ